MGHSEAPGDALEASGYTSEASGVRKCVFVVPSAVMMARAAGHSGSRKLSSRHLIRSEKNKLWDGFFLRLQWHIIDFNYKNLRGRSAGQERNYFCLSLIYSCIFVWSCQFIRQSYDYHGDNSAAMSLSWLKSIKTLKHNSFLCKSNKRGRFF